MFKLFMSGCIVGFSTYIAMAVTSALARAEDEQKQEEWRTYWRARGYPV